MPCRSLSSFFSVSCYSRKSKPDFFSGFRGFVDRAEDLDHIEALDRLEIGLDALLYHVDEVAHVAVMSVDPRICVRMEVEQIAVLVFAEHVDRAVVMPRAARLRAAELDEARLALDVGRPRELDLQARAVVESDKAHREVFDVERAAVLLRAECGVNGVRCRAVVRELVEGAAGDRDRRRVAHQPHRKVDHVHAEVDQRAAAGLRLRGKPAALAGDSAAADPSAASAVDLAHVAVGDVFLHENGVAVIAVVAHDHENFSRFFGGGLHLQRLFHVDRIGLLAEHVTAVIKRADRDDGVEIVRRCDVDDVEVFFVDHFREIFIFVNAFYAEPHFGIIHFGRDDIADGDDLHAGVLRIIFKVDDAEIAYSDAAESQFAHIFILFFLFFGRDRTARFVKFSIAYPAADFKRNGEFPKLKIRPAQRQNGYFQRNCSKHRSRIAPVPTPRPTHFFAENVSLNTRMPNSAEVMSPPPLMTGKKTADGMTPDRYMLMTFTAATPRPVTINIAKSGFFGE